MPTANAKTPQWTNHPSWNDELYRITFDACKNNTTEKQDTTKVQGKLSQILLQLEALPSQRNLRITDFGSDDCATLIAYIDAAKFLHKADIMAIDIKPQAVADGKKKLAANSNSSGNIANFSVITGDVYKSELKEILGNRSSDIIFMSHIAYEVSSQEIVQMLNTANQAMCDQGAAIAYHVKQSPHGLVDLRNRFGQRADVKNANSADVVKDPSVGICNAATQLEMQVCETEYAAKIFFKKISTQEWSDLKNPDKFLTLSAAAQENLKLISFIALRSPQEMAADQTERNLSNYVDAVHEIILANQNQQHDGGYVPAVLAVQLISSSRASTETKNKHQQAIKTLTQSIDNLLSQNHYLPTTTPSNPSHQQVAAVNHISKL